MQFGVFEMHDVQVVIDGDSQTRMVYPHVSNVLPSTSPYKQGNSKHHECTIQITF